MVTRIRTKTKAEKRADRHGNRSRYWRAQAYKARAELAEPSPPPWTPPVCDFADWAMSNLRVPSGLKAGAPFRLDDWQREFISAAASPDVTEAALSVARKNGKTGLIAAWMLSFLAGPDNRPNWRGIAISLTAQLAKELYRAVEHTAEVSGLGGYLEFRKTPYPGRIVGQRGAELQFLASDKATGHAVGADVAVIDEAGLLEENRRDLWNAVLASVVGRRGKLICISIQGHSPMFEEMRLRRDEPGVVWHEYANSWDVDALDENAWRRANPGLASDILSLDTLKHLAGRASRNASDLAAFRTLHLNAPGTPLDELIVSLDDLRAVETASPPPRRGEVFVGFDLGGSRSMTAGAFYWPSSGRLECYGAFARTPTLAERGRNDLVGQLYVAMSDEGELFALGNRAGRTTPVADFVNLLEGKLAGETPRYVCGDRYRQSELEDAMLDVGWRLEFRGQGWRDGSEDVRNFQRAVLDGQVSMAPSRLLRHAVSESKLLFDPAGNPKLDKSRYRGRIDALAAAVMAVSAGMRHPARRLSLAPMRAYGGV